METSYSYLAKSLESSGLHMEFVGNKNYFRSLQLHPPEFSSYNVGGTHINNFSHPNQSSNLYTEQFKLDLSQIMDGTDTRTTIMIKNIPNTYVNCFPYICQ